MTIKERLARWLLKSMFTPYSGERYSLIGGQIIGSPDNKKSYLKNGYNINDTLYSIVQLVTEKVRVAPWGVYKVEDEQAMKEMAAIYRKGLLSPKELQRAKDLKRKALAPYTKDGRLNELLKYPNEDGSMSDLCANSCVSKMLMGDRAIYIEKLQAGANAGKPWRLHILPTQDLTIIASYGAFPVKVIGYAMYGWGWDKIPKEDVIFDKYFNPNIDTSGSHLYGLAPMKAAMRLTDRSNSENTAATSSYQNLGPRYVVFTDDVRLGPDTAQAHVSALKNRLTSEEYAGPDNYNKFAVSAYKTGAVPIGLSPVDLNIIESEQWSMRRFCNVFGVPSQLLNDSERSTYNSVTEAEQALTLRAAMPLLNTFRDSFNRAMFTQMGYDSNIVIDYDISVYKELQEDLSKMWSWVQNLPVPNGYKLDMMGLDHPENSEEWMNTILVQSGYSTAQDYAGNQTDQDLAAGNA